MRWQYKVILIDITSALLDAELEERLADMGADGWELVTSLREGSVERLVFKRSAGWR